MSFLDILGHLPVYYEFKRHENWYVNSYCEWHGVGSWLAKYWSKSKEVHSRWSCSVALSPSKSVHPVSLGPALHVLSLLDVEVQSSRLFQLALDVQAYDGLRQLGRCCQCETPGYLLWPYPCKGWTWARKGWIPGACQWWSEMVSTGRRGTGRRWWCWCRRTRSTVCNLQEWCENGGNARWGIWPIGDGCWLHAWAGTGAVLVINGSGNSSLNVESKYSFQHCKTQGDCEGRRGHCDAGPLW